MSTPPPPPVGQFPFPVLPGTHRVSFRIFEKHSIEWVWFVWRSESPRAWEGAFGANIENISFAQMFLNYQVSNRLQLVPQTVLEGRNHQQLCQSKIVCAEKWRMLPILVEQISNSTLGQRGGGRNWKMVSFALLYVSSKYNFFLTNVTSAVDQISQIWLICRPSFDQRIWFMISSILFAKPWKLLGILSTSVDNYIKL